MLGLCYKYLLATSDYGFKVVAGHVNSHIIVYCRFPFIKHMFYDNSLNDRKPGHKFLQTLDKLTLLGASVTDEKLVEANNNVKPDYILHHLFTSVHLRWL